MRLLTMKCKSVDTTLKLPANRPREVIFVEEGSVGDSLSFSERVAVFICVEKKDEDRANIAEITATEIQKILGRLEADTVLLIPFAHLTKEIADPPSAYSTVKEIQKRLVAKKFKTDRFQFGWHRTLHMDIIGGQDSVLYNEI
jgi:threonyl-tRNA synthetase